MIDEKIPVVSYGVCVDCGRDGKEVTLNQDGSCSVCGSNSTFKPGQIQALGQLNIKVGPANTNGTNESEKDETEKDRSEENQSRCVLSSQESSDQSEETE